MSNKKILDPIKGVHGSVSFIGTDGKNFVPMRKANLSLNALYSHIVDCLRDGTSVTKYIDRISLGTGGHSAGDDTTPIPPEPDDTALESEIDPPGKKSIVSRTSATSYEVEYSTTFLKSECNARITEAGLWLNSPNDVLTNRVTFPAFEKTSSLILIVRWNIYFTI